MEGILLTCIFEEKIRIGISACMYGSKVRYNSKGYEMIGYLNREKSNYIWTPVCPEVMSGMGVPRLPIRLTNGNGYEFWTGDAKVKNKNGRDVSSMMKEGAEACFETLKRANVDAYIFMEGSPSCGVYRTTLRNKRLGNPPGVFGALLLEKGIFLIPAQDLQSPVKWWDWRRRLSAFVWLKHRQITNLKELYNTWHILKFLCQEVNEKFARELGKTIAQFKTEQSLEVLEDIRWEILNTLRKPSDIKKVKQWLWKNYIFLKKHEKIKLESVCPPEIYRNMTSIVDEMIAVEREVKDKNILFGTSPIIYSPRR
jgi:uncharacterized protein YbbK (DUF523 family)